MTAFSVAANLGGLALFALSGLGFGEWIPALRRLPLGRRLGYAYLLGVVATGASLFVLSHLFGVPLRRPAITVVAAVPMGLGLLRCLTRRRKRAVAARTARRDRPWRLGAGLLITAVLLGPLTSALTAPLADWDGRMTWCPLAAAMRHEGTVDPSVMRGAHWFVVNSPYPPLLPLAQTTVQEVFGAGEDEQDFRALYVGFLVALLLVLYDGARRAAGPSAAILTILCAALPPFLSYGAGGATSAYSDLALAAFYGAAVVLLLLARPRLSSAGAGGLLLAGAILSKSEGVWLAVPVFLLAAIRLWRRRDGLPRAALARLTAAAVPGLAAVALLASWRAGIPARIDVHFFSGLRVSDLVLGALRRSPQILPETLRWTFRWADWSGFWILFLAVLIVGAPALRRRSARLMLAAGLFPLAVAWGAYSVSPSTGALIGETWDRFLVQGLIPLMLAFSYALARLLRQIRLRSRRGSASSPAAAAQGTP
jgi:Dolichyl-phosphate-mannose-protein mannosyltransferase